MKEILTNALVDIGIAMLIALGGAAVALIKAKISQINAASTNDTENKTEIEESTNTEREEKTLTKLKTKKTKSKQKKTT